MITDVKLIKYFRDEDKIESEIESVSIFTDVVEDDYELDYQLEFGDEFTFTGSNINMEFFDSDTLRDSFQKSNFNNGYFFGIEIYLDNSTSPEFWGYVDPRTIEYDYDKSTYKLTVVDWMAYYWDIWQEATAGTDFIVQYLSLDSMMIAWLDKYLVSDVNMQVGTMNKIVNSKGWLDSKYTLTDYLKETQKHYGAYMYFTADKVLNYVNRMETLSSDVKYIADYIINIIESGYEVKSYKAIAISYLYGGTDPNLFSIGGGGLGDADVLILSDGNGWIIPMPFENEVAIDDFDRALVESFPKYRFNHLDLRQRMQQYGTYDPFSMLTLNPIAYEMIAPRYNAYKNIFEDTLLLKIEVNGYDYDLLDKISQNKYPNPFGEEIFYQVIGIKKYLQSERAILTLREII